MSTELAQAHSVEQFITACQLVLLWDSATNVRAFTSDPLLLR